MGAVAVRADRHLEVACGQRDAVTAGVVLGLLVDPGVGREAPHVARIGVAAAAEGGLSGPFGRFAVGVHGQIGVHGGEHVVGEGRVRVAAVAVVAGDADLGVHVGGVVTSVNTPLPLFW